MCNLSFSENINNKFHIRDVRFAFESVQYVCALLRKRSQRRTALPSYAASTLTRGTWLFKICQGFLSLILHTRTHIPFGVGFNSFCVARRPYIYALYLICIFDWVRRASWFTRRVYGEWWVYARTRCDVNTKNGNIYSYYIETFPNVFSFIRRVELAGIYLCGADLKWFILSNLLYVARCIFLNTLYTIANIWWNTRKDNSIFIRNCNILYEEAFRSIAFSLIDF